MKPAVDARCMICQLIFCCTDCRYKHEKTQHGLTYDCPICRGHRYLCKPEELNEDFIKHLFKEHLPLHCSKCDKYFRNMEDFLCIDDCTSISDLINLDEHTDKLHKAVDDKFTSLYKKVIDNDGDNVEGIISVNKTNKTAVITPIIRKKYLVDYESSDSEEENPKSEEIQTTHPKWSGKTITSRQRAATPHVKKFLSLMRQKNVEEYDEIDDHKFNESPDNKKTPSRTEYNPGAQKEMTTPTSHMSHLAKLAQTVTTSTPTHPATGGWSLFPDPGADSPLSEIENPGSPAQNLNSEPSKIESECVPPKLKSIIITNSRIRLGSQDSSEKQVTFQDSTSNTDASLMKTKKVKFAEDTVFDEGPKVKRVYRKPRRMLTPGPQRQRFCFNPRFQALVNRFENRGLIMARTPPTNREILPETTPQTGDPSTMSARAINFKDGSPVIENEYSTESNECYSSCLGSPDPGIDTAITAFSTNVAGTLQKCLTSVLRTSEEETEIQFKFTITKKKVSIKRIVEQSEGVDEKSSEVDRNACSNKENIWSCVARAVRNVFWGDQGNLTTSTPYRSLESINSSSSSTSKRKCEEMTDPESSPLNHKKHKYEGRIRGRPPLARSYGVSTLRTCQSEEQQSSKNEMSFCQEDEINLSF